MLNDGRRTADVRAASDLECLEVDFDTLDDGIRARLLINLAGQLARRLERDAEETRELG